MPSYATKAAWYGWPQPAIPQPQPTTPKAQPASKGKFKTKAEPAKNTKG